MYAIVRSLHPETVVEIGSAYGKSTCYIAAGLSRNKFGKLYSIDPHTSTNWNDGDNKTNTYAIVMNRLFKLRLTDYVEPIRLFSDQAIKKWNTEIDILLIDGSHQYDEVKNDFYGFIKYVKENGLIIFHDTMWEHYRDNKYYRSDQGVPKFVSELQSLGYPMVTLMSGWGLTIIQNCRNSFDFLAKKSGDAI